VHALGTRGAHILVHYHRQENEARGVLERLEQAGGRGNLVPADLSTMDGVRRLVQAVDGA
jgi:hypothetical protein